MKRRVPRCICRPASSCVAIRSRAASRTSQELLPVIRTVRAPTRGSRVRSRASLPTAPACSSRTRGNYRLRKAVPGSTLPSALQTYATTNISTALGTVSTFAGNATNANVDGTGTGASFWNPAGGVVIDGYAYVGTTSSIRKVSLADGSVTTLAGASSTAGCVDSTDSSQVRFKNVSARYRRPYLYSLSDACSGANAALGARITRDGSDVDDRRQSCDGHTDGVRSGRSGLFPRRLGCVQHQPNRWVSPMVASVTYTGRAIAADANSLWVMSAAVSGSSELDHIDISGYAVGSTITTSASNMSSRRRWCRRGTICTDCSDTQRRLQRLCPGAGREDRRVVCRPSREADPKGTGYADGTGTAAQLGTIVGLASDGRTSGRSTPPTSGCAKIIQATGPSLLESRVPNTSQLTCGCRRAGDPVDVASGNYYESFTDLPDPGPQPGARRDTYLRLAERRIQRALRLWLVIELRHAPAARERFAALDGGCRAGKRRFVSFSWNGSSYVAPSFVCSPRSSSMVMARTPSRAAQPSSLCSTRPGS